MRKIIIVLIAGILANLFTGTAADASTRHEAPIGYRYDVSTLKGYRFHALKHEDSNGPGVWNAVIRGNGQGQSFVKLAHTPPTRIMLGVNDTAQGGDYNGVAAWTKHYVVRVHNEVIYRLHGYVAEVDTTIDVRLPHGKIRTFYVIASAVWR